MSELEHTYPYLTHEERGCSCIRGGDSVTIEEYENWTQLLMQRLNTAREELKSIKCNTK